MKLDDEADARSEARSIVQELAEKHRERIAAVRRPADVWTELAAPLAAARKRYQHRVVGSLRDRGIFEAAVHEELVAPFEARLAREQADEDRSAVRDGDYRKAGEKPEPPKAPEIEPRPESAPSPPEEDRPVDPLADQRSTGSIFLAVGVLAALAMGAVAIHHVSGETLSGHVRATFVGARCRIVETKENEEEGGGRSYTIRFANVASDQKYVNERYSPDVARPSVANYKTGDEVECVCDPQNPAVCFLYKGEETKREELPWIYVLAIPGLFVGIGLWMRYSTSVLDGSD